ncbi:MAG: SEL1-like repeat protein [Acidobacteriota bacterium]|nr:SEL1-like repeat protein [Acidobacteriota bacterium]
MRTFLLLFLLIHQVSAAEDTPDVLARAVSLYIGTDGGVDYAAARPLFRQAADSGDPLARMWLARMFFRGRCGFMEDKKKGLAMAEPVLPKIIECAESGDIECVFLLASSIEEGMGGEEPDPAGSVPWYLKAAEAGHPGAMNNLGVLYHSGLGVEQDSEKARTWYGSALGKGNVGAMNNLGSLLRAENPNNLTEALAWFRKAAEMGYPPAQTNLAVLLEEGSGVEPALEEAADWYRKAAAQGDARAMTSLGVIYAKGSGVEQDEAQALEWFKKAVDRKYAEASFQIGLLYLDREDMEETGSQNRAVMHFLRAADLGHGGALYRLAELFEEGRGVPKDMIKAVAYLRRGVARGHSPSRTRLGDMHLVGTGRVLRDYREAAELFQAAAEAGHPRAQNRLGQLYALGVGVPKDLDKAQRWFDAAMSKGYPASSLDDLAAIRQDLGIGFRFRQLIAPGIVGLVLVSMLLFLKKRG